MEKAIDHLIIHPFSKEFSRMSSMEFVRDILVNKLGVKKLITAMTIILDVTEKVLYRFGRVGTGLQFYC